MKELGQLILKPGKEKTIINKHPWVFSGAVDQNSAKDNGQIVQVCDHEKKVLGLGFYSPKSQIMCRLFEFSDFLEPINKSYWAKKVQIAWQIRQSIYEIRTGTTNCFRLIHAEGDFFPGLIADVYGPKILVLQVLIKGTERLLPTLVSIFQGLGFEHIYLKSKALNSNTENMRLASGWLCGGLGATEKIEIKENNAVFVVDIENGQKTGFFLDQRNNRTLLSKYAKGKTVFNAFCYSGGFSVYALRGGATLVHSLDSSAPALELCRQNMAANTKPSQSPSLDFFEADCFDYFAKNTTLYDIVVIDPPAFAKNAGAVANASRGYKELNMKAIKAVNAGGLVFTFSCSQHISTDLFQKIVFSAAADSGRNVRIIHQMSQAEDHPINIFHPEGNYLKGLVLWVD